MLEGLKAENFRSIRKEALLSLTEGNKPAASVAVLTGSNGSGKTAFLQAASAAQKILNDSLLRTPGSEIKGLEPFLFDPAAREEPFRFEVRGFADGKKFVYSFSAARNEILEESLFLYLSSRLSKVFERNGQTVSAGSKWKADVHSLAKITQKNRLLLGVGANLLTPPEILQPVPSFPDICIMVYLAIAGGIQFYSRESLSACGKILLSDSIGQDPEKKQLLLGWMQKAGFNVSDFTFFYKEPDPSALGFFGNDQRIRECAANRLCLERSFLVRKSRSKDIRQYLDTVSAGEVYCLELFAVLLEAFENGTSLLLDDMDAGLSPELIAFVTSLFQDQSINPNGAQLIFTTTNPALPDFCGLRNEQVYCVRKDPESQETSLFRLSDLPKEAKTASSSNPL